MVDYFEGLAAAEAVGRGIDEESLAALAARCSMRVLGPVPEGCL